MLPSNLSNDGLCRDIINARLYNGAVRPIGTHTSLQTTGVVSGAPHFIHTVTNGDKYILAYNSTSGVVSYTKVPSGSKTTLTTLSVSQTIRFAALKNVLLIINDTAETMAYCLFSLDSETYSYIGTQRFPDAINIEFKSTANTSGDVESDNLSYSGTADTDNDTIQAELLKLEADNWNHVGKFTGSIAIVYAWEMFDGSIVKHSTPFYLRSGRWYWKAIMAVPPPTNLKVKICDYDNTFEIKTINTALDAIRTTYGDIIKSLNIYMTRPLNTYKEESDTHLSITYIEVDKDSETTVQKKVIQDQSYYLVRKIALDKLEYGYSDDIYSSDIDDIPTLEPMPVDNFTHHDIYPDNDFLYNSRLFLGKIKTTLFDGFSPNNVRITKPALHVNDYANPYRIYFEVEIKGGGDTKTVISDQYQCVYYLDILGIKKISFGLAVYTGYPDSRASKLTVKVVDNLVHYKVAEYNLVAHPALNMAYIDPDDMDTQIGEYSPDWGVDPQATLSNVIIDENRVQASKVDNAFYFPAENSYRVGSGEVVGMGANALLIDTGQFGEFPIYVFTDSGVWAMAISNDPSILIDRIVPATRDVCSNGKSILSTEYGVVFFSNEGVMLLSGMKSARISLPMEGDYESILDDNPNFSLLQASKLQADISSYIEDVSFLTFLETAVAGYNYKHKELIISNPVKNYSYLYSFQTSSWYRAGFKYTSFVNNFPGFLGERSGTLYDITEEDYSTVTHIPVFIETAPMKLEMDGFKKIIALALRGKLSLNTKTAGVYLFGSIDLSSWHLLNASQKQKSCQDILVGRSPYSVCYLAVVITGTIGEDSYLTHLDISYQDRFRNRIR